MHAKRRQVIVALLSYVIDHNAEEMEEENAQCSRYVQQLQRSERKADRNNIAPSAR